MPNVVKKKKREREGGWEGGRDGEGGRGRERKEGTEKEWM
jgi:hypothetical protein